jgi:hypothetical protein
MTALKNKKTNKKTSQGTLIAVVVHHWCYSDAGDTTEKERELMEVQSGWRWNGWRKHCVD